MCGPLVHYAPRPWPAYMLAYEGQADELAAVVAETWDRVDEVRVFICMRCDVVWQPRGAPPPCEHLTAVQEARRDAHAD